MRTSPCSSDFRRDDMRAEWMERIRRTAVEAARAVFDDEPFVLFLYGSVAQRTERSSSDLDIGLWCPAECGLARMAKLRDALEESLPTLRGVDLVDFTRILDEDFVREALRSAETWYLSKACSDSWENFRTRMRD